MGVEDQSQSAAQPAGKSKPSPQGRRGRSFGPNRRGRGRRPTERPSGSEPGQVTPTEVESPSYSPEPALPPSTEAESAGVDSPFMENQARELPPATGKFETESAGEPTDATAPMPIASTEPPGIEQRQAPTPSRPAAFSRPAPYRHPQVPERRPSPEPPPKKDFRPASQRSVQEAIDDVSEIVETLRTTLEDMEELLETLELAERQKDADEQEIESLRRSLRQLHRPRDSGQREGRPRESGQREGGQRESGPRESGPRESGPRESGHRR
jgi:hypothetical protein